MRKKLLKTSVPGKQKARRRKQKRNMKKAEENVLVGWENAKQKKWAIRTLMKKQNGLCAICEEQMNLIKNDPKQASLDHIEPLSRGGLNTINNIQLAHRICNEKKGSTYEREEAGFS